MILILLTTKTTARHEVSRQQKQDGIHGLISPRGRDLCASGEFFQNPVNGLRIVCETKL
jgi:hypothetical protein